MTRKLAQETLLTTNSADKNELLFSSFGINYNNLDQSFRKGSVIYRRLKQQEVDQEYGLSVSKAKVKKRKTELTVQHCDIIGDAFWREVGCDLLDVNGEMNTKREEE